MKWNKVMALSGVKRKDKRKEIIAGQQTIL